MTVASSPLPRIVGRIIISGILAIVLLIFALGAAVGWLVLAHEWYPPDCCSGHDCAPLLNTRVERMADGTWRVDGEYIFPAYNPAQPYGETRLSQSGRFHACFPNEGRPKCFFVPPDGF